MDDLKNKTIVITGAAGLLGSAFVKNFADKGSTLVLVDNSSEINKTSDALVKRGIKSSAYVGDISKKEFWTGLENSLSLKHINANVLINGACVKTENFFNVFEEFPVADWNQVFDVNLTGAMLACQIFGSKFAKQKNGSIINIASIYGVVAPDQRIYDGSEYLGRNINTPAVYSASKSGLIGLTKHLAAYWGKDNVRVNCVTPGGVFSGQNKTFVEKYCAKTPLQRMAKPEDIFGAVAFLSSDMSDYITGHNLIVDGGWTVW